MRAGALEHLQVNGATVPPASHGSRRDRTASDGWPSSLQLFRAEGDEVIEGVVWANEVWYRIEEGILDAQPDALAPRARRAAFAARHGLTLPASASPVAEDDAKKVEQIDFFREDSIRYDREVSDRPFYVASDRISFGAWESRLTPGGMACDIGAGTGRITLPLARKGFTVVSTDISEEMLRLARQRAVDEHLDARVTYVLADAERLPFRDNLFDAAACYGALHHVPGPGALVAEAGRILKPGGRWLSYDPHNSRVRFLLDWVMRAMTLYQELASGNPLIARDDVVAWCRKAGLRADVTLHFFLPPHLLTRCSVDTAERWLRLSDRAFNAIGLGSFAGVIVVSGVKQP